MNYQASHSYRSYKTLIIKIILFTLFLSSIFINDINASKVYYTWEDKYGVIHITDDSSSIPQEYKKTAKKYEPTNKKDRYLYKTQFLIKKYYQEIIYIFLISLIALLFIVIFNKSLKLVKQKKLTSARSELEQIIEQSGIERMNSETYKTKVKEVLKNQGYKISEPDSMLTTLIDLIGFKDGTKIAISINDSNNLISKIVVSEIDREKHKFSCKKSMVVSRSYFEEDAYDFAKNIGCRLIDKDSLARLILKSKN